MAELDEWKPKDLSWDLNYTISMIFSESQFRGIQSMKSPHFWPLKWRLASKIAQNDVHFGDILAHRKLLQDIWRNFQMFWSLDLKSFIFESFGYFRLKWELISNLFQENSAHCPSPTVRPPSPAGISDPGTTVVWHLRIWAKQQIDTMRRAALLLDSRTAQIPLLGTLSRAVLSSAH